MTDLISRQAAIDVVCSVCEVETPKTCSTIQNGDRWCFEVYNLLNLPSAEPVQREECEYIITKGKAGYHEEYKCSVCGDSFYWTQDRNIPSKFNYCRNCGRKVIRFIEKEVNTTKRESE